MSDCFVKACSENEIPEGELKAVNINGLSMILANANGRIYALEDCCSHDGAELRDGDVIEGQVQCSRHGGRFDLETGNATQMPAIVGIKSYKVEIRSGDIYIAV